MYVCRIGLYERFAKMQNFYKLNVLRFNPNYKLI